MFFAPNISLWFTPMPVKNKSIFRDSRSNITFSIHSRDITKQRIKKQSTCGKSSLGEIRAETQAKSSVITSFFELLWKRSKSLVASTGTWRSECYTESPILSTLKGVPSPLSTCGYFFISARLVMGIAFCHMLQENTNQGISCSWFVSLICTCLSYTQRRIEKSDHIVL